jgi:hypothetical protein
MVASDTELTPVDMPPDRPLMRSDLSMVYLQLDGVRKAVHSIEQLAVEHYSQVKAARKEARSIAALCVACAIWCFGCAVAVYR